MNYYILFSGGFDSTYSIVETLKEIKKKGTEDADKIFLLRVSFNMLGDKDKREAEACRKIFNFFKEHTRVPIDLRTLKVSYTSRLGLGGLKQPLLWVPALISLAVDSYKDGKLIFPYILGNQAAQYKNEISTIVETSFILYKANEKDCKLVPSFPLILKEKIDILIDLMDYSPELFGYCVTCEDYNEYEEMQKRFCRRCIPCFEFRCALNNAIMKLEAGGNNKVLYELIKYQNKYFPDDANKHSMEIPAERLATKALDEIRKVVSEYRLKEREDD